MPTDSCCCGESSYKNSSSLSRTAVCHRIDCQKWPRRGCTSNVIIPTGMFKLTKGTPKCITNLGESRMSHPHFFCGRKCSARRRQKLPSIRTHILKQPLNHLPVSSQQP
ncbi:hypothetical protein BDZ45DRAFT_663604 [Acephala macrosclerotiorum]|nr:hypothetical protein BDZ45DRAFT_663604 [Acephala macrosclerotiorum]